MAEYGLECLGFIQQIYSVMEISDAGHSGLLGKCQGAEKNPCTL